MKNSRLLQSELERAKELRQSTPYSIRWSVRLHSFTGPLDNIGGTEVYPDDPRFPHRFSTDKRNTCSVDAVFQRGL